VNSLTNKRYSRTEKTNGQGQEFCLNNTLYFGLFFSFQTLSYTPEHLEYMGMGSFCDTFASFKNTLLHARYTGSMEKWESRTF